MHNVLLIFPLINLYNICVTALTNIILQILSIIVVHIKIHEEKNAIRKNTGSQSKEVNIDGSTEARECHHGRLDETEEKLEQNTRAAETEA